MDFNEKQLEAINADKSDVLVSASAGSGKTTVMIERVLRHIESGVDIKRMLIVTFTKAAAADMRAKLGKALEERESKSAYARKALKSLPAADISTLHSFCGKLARTYFYAIDADPAFELIGDGDCALFDRCLDEAVEWAASEGAQELYEIMLSSRKDKPFRAAVKRVYDAAVGTPDPSGFFEHCLDMSLDDVQARKPIAESLDKERRKLEAKVRDLTVACGAAGFTRNAAALGEVASALELGDESVMGRSPSTKVDPAFEDLNEEFKFLKEKTKAHLKRVKECAELPESKLSHDIAASLVKTAEKLAEIYAREKGKSALADYNDLEHYAYKILCSDCGEAIRDSFDAVFVDEYQDINPLQDAIITKIKRDGNLFMVGDLKQSIYAFRGCDPSIFAEKSRRFARGEGTAVELNANFRTCPEIIENVNRVFSRCMTEEFGGVDYEGTAKLVPSREGDGKFRYVSVVVPKAESPEREDVYSLREHSGEIAGAADAESDFVVEQILELLNPDRKNPVNPEDIAVLTRSRGELSYLIRDKLARAGVSAFVKEGADPRFEPETAPLIALLRLTRNPLDDIALTAALTSFVGGLDAGELADIAASKPHDEPFCVAARKSEKTREFFERLDRYTELSQSVSAARLMSQMALDSDAFTEADRVSDDRHAALSAFIASLEGMTSSQALDMIDTAAAGEKAAPEGSLKIMTVHMSKGLEFEHVFLVGVSRGFNRKDFSAPFYIDRKWGLCMKYPDPLTHEWKPTFLTEAARLELEKRTLEEEMRIMYVALTRAKKTLTVSGCNIEATEDLKREFGLPSKPADFLFALCPERVEVEKDASDESAGGEGQRVVVPLPGARADGLRERMDYKCPADTSPAKTSVSAVIAGADEGYYTGESAGYDEGGDEGSKAERGTAFHLFMQGLDLNGDFEIQCAHFAARYPAEANLVDFDAARTAARLVRELVRGREIYREKEFVYPRGSTLVQGVIDLLAVGDGGAIIVDYKTGKHVKKLRYKEQLKIYGEAVEKVLGLKIDGLYICALDLGEIFSAEDI